MHLNFVGSMKKDRQVGCFEHMAEQNWGLLHNEMENFKSNSWSAHIGVKLDLLSNNLYKFNHQATCPSEH